MFREKEQISDIVIATKVALKTKNKINYLPFEYEKSIEFLFTKNKVFFFERSYKAKTIEEWYKYCLKLGLEDIQILLPVSSVNSNIPNELNTNKNKFICYFKNNLVLYFTAKWNATSGGWNIIYTAHKYENSTNEKIKFYDNTEDFRNILIKIRDFSNEIGVKNFANIFNYAFELLDEKKYIMNKEKFPLNFLPDKNARLYVSSMTANVFGGMGSWNDGVPYCAYEKGLTDEYDKLSKELSEQIELATMYALNEW